MAGPLLGAHGTPLQVQHFTLLTNSGRSKGLISSCVLNHPLCVTCSMLNIVFVIPFITVVKSKMYWQGVKSIAFDVKGKS